MIESQWKTRYGGFFIMGRSIYNN